MISSSPAEQFWMVAGENAAALFLGVMLWYDRTLPIYLYIKKVFLKCLLVTFTLIVDDSR